MNPLFLLPFLLPVLTTADMRTVMGMPRPLEHGEWLLAGIAFIAAFSRSLRLRLPRTIGVTALIGFLAIAYVAPAPLRTSAIVAAAMTAASLVVPWFANALGFLTAIVATCAIHWLLPYVLVRFDPAAAASRPLAAIAALVGFDAAPTLHGVAFGASGQTGLEVGVSFMRLALREAVALTCGAALLVTFMLRRGERWPALWRFVLAALLAVVVRFVIVVIGAHEGADANDTADPWWRSVTLGLPLLFFLGILDRSRSRAPDAGFTESDSPWTPRRWFEPAFVTCGALLLSAASLAPGPVRVRPGRIAIDEYHSRWERIDVALKRDLFGTRAVYNYSEWVRALGERYGGVKRVRDRIDDATLAEVDVLILKTPTEPLTIGEVAAIDSFVRRGGGLYLVGDHTDVFGMNTILNSVCRPYGIEYHTDALFETDYLGGMVTDGRAMPPHPITSTMRPLHWMTSCSIGISGTARPLIWVSAGFSDAPDFSKFTFFGDSKLDASEPLGPFAQAATAEPGEGRVLAFADSTLFSNFSIFFPGVRELSFGGVDWLLQRERWPHWHLVAAALGVVILLMGARRLADLGAARPAVLGLLITAGFGGGLLLADGASHAVMQRWDESFLGRETVFDKTVSDGRLPLWHESHDAPDDFWSLFLAYQRTGGLMRVAMPGEDPFDGAAAILVWPKIPLPDEFVERARTFVRDGGRLYLFDDRAARGSAAPAIVAAFGLTLEPLPPGRIVATRSFEPTEAMLTLTAPSTIVRGGAPIVSDVDGRPLVAVQSFGAGAIVVSGVAQDFSNASLGPSDRLKDERAFDLQQLLYRIIDAPTPQASEPSW